MRIAIVRALVVLLLVATGCGDDTSPSALPRCEDICPMDSHDSWLCVRNPKDGIERCACAANHETPEPCEGDL